VTVKHLVQGSAPLRDHHVATDPDGTRTLLSYGVPVAQITPGGIIIVPPGWESATRLVSTKRAGFLGIAKRELAAAVQYSRVWLQVAEIPVPAVWLTRYGPDSPEPYTVD